MQRFPPRGPAPEDPFCGWHQPPQTIRRAAGRCAPVIFAKGTCRYARRKSRPGRTTRHPQAGDAALRAACLPCLPRRMRDRRDRVPVAVILVRGSSGDRVFPEQSEIFSRRRTTGAAGDDSRRFREPSGWRNPSPTQGRTALCALPVRWGTLRPRPASRMDFGTASGNPRTGRQLPRRAKVNPPARADI